MKTCPNCGEMNGESNDKCYKCGADLLEATNRYCRNCDEVYSSKVSTCPTCGESTVVYNPFTMSKQTHHNNNYIETWMYVIAVLFPIIGFILGCIRFGKDDSTGSRNLILTSAITVTACFVIWRIVASFSL